MACEWHNLSRGVRLARRVAEARGALARMRGLLGRRELAAGEGLWLRPCRQVHTFFLRFAIDVVFLDRELMVVGICRGLKPWRLSPFFLRARSALELSAGAARGLRPGDRLAPGRAWP